MQENGKQNDGFGPFGICHRLFNFIMNSILTRGTRRVTLGTTNTASPHDDEIRAFEASHTGEEDHVTRPDGHELLVEFRHNKGSMPNRTSNTPSQVLVQETRNSTQTRKETDSQDQGKGNGDREKSTKKSTLTIVDGGNLPGRKHHLLSVASNINEKADAFIRSRKEAMQKTLSMKQANDV